MKVEKNHKNPNINSAINSKSVSEINSSDKTSTIIISVLSAVTSLLSFLVQAVILKKYGISCSADAYFLGVGGPSIVSSLLAGILINALTPELKARCYWVSGYQSNLMGLIAGFSVISIILALLVAIFYTPIVGNDACQNNVVLILQMYSASIPIAVLISILSVVNQVNGNLNISAYIQPWPSLIQLTILVFTNDSIPIYWLGVGYLIGCLAQLSFVLKGFHITKQFDFEIFFNILKVSPLIGTSLAIFGLNTLSDLYWAARMPQGSITYLANCQRIIVGLTGVVLAGVSTVVLNRLSAMQKTSRMERADYINSWLIVYCFVVLPITIAVSASSVDVVRILFMRGMFSKLEADKMSVLLGLIIWGMLPMGASTILFRAIFAERGVIFLSILGLSGTAVYFVLSGLLVETIGLKGIAISYIIVWCLVVLFSKIYLSGLIQAFKSFITPLAFVLAAPIFPLMILQQKLIGSISIIDLDQFFISLIRFVISLVLSSIIYLIAWVVYKSDFLKKGFRFLFHLEYK